MTSAEQDALKNFARYILEETFDSRDIEGGDVQDYAYTLGLLLKTKYDPDRHPEAEDCELGDDWFEFAEFLKC